MRVLAGLAWASIALQVRGASHEATVYYLDKNSTPPNALPPSVSPTTARLLLAQRLGLSQYHSLKNADASTIEQLNSLDLSQTPIFRDEELDEKVARVLVIVEGCSEGIRELPQWKPVIFLTG